MSRIGNKPITVPSEVTVKVEGQKVTVTGPKGTLEKEFDKNISIELDGNVIIDRGIAISWSEYSQDGTLLRTFKTTGGKFVYRVFKYDYLDYWFQ